MKHPLTAEEKLLIVAPNFLRKEFLHMAHNAAGHLGTAKTIARLSDLTYWHSQECRVPLHSLCHLPDGESSSKTTSSLTAHSDQQTMGNGGRGHS